MIVAADHPWLPVFVLPVVLVHRSLRRSIELRAATRAAVEELTGIVDRRDPDKGGHSARVAAFVARLAQRLELPTPEAEIAAPATAADRPAPAARSRR